ncbi:MAG: hypothetical protein ACE5K7_00780 [Phycisphaerae bacterium]
MTTSTTDGSDTRAGHSASLRAEVPAWRDPSDLGRAMPTLLALCLMAVPVCLGGCGQTPQWWRFGRQGNRLSPQQVMRIPTESDIVRVLAMYDADPWLVTRTAESFRAEGIRIRSLYLISAKTNKGVFGDGLIRVLLYRLDRDGRRHKLQEWQFDRQQALPWRATERSWLGYGYQFDLAWPKQLDLAGQEIVIIVEYVRSDGTVVRSTPKHFLVPKGR